VTGDRGEADRQQQVAFQERLVRAKEPFWGMASTWLRNSQTYVEDREKRASPDRALAIYRESWN
jgi:hypothetical protein